MDLLKKLQFATVRLDTNFIDIGNPHFRSHLLDGWGADRKDEEKINSAAVAQRTAELKFFCHSPQDRMLTIRCKTESGSAEAQSLDVILNSRRIAKRTIRSVYEDHAISLPATALVPGENRIRFVLSINRKKSNRMNPGISFDSLKFSAPDDREAVNTQSTQHPKGIRWISIPKNGPASVLQAPAKSTLSFYERIPKNARLNVEFGFIEDGSRKSSVLFGVKVETEQGVSEQLLSEQLKRGYFQASAQIKSLSLEKYENQVVRISLESSPVANQQAPGAVYWAKVHLVSPKSAAPVAQTRLAPKKNASHPNIYLYIIDALRADHLKPYGYSKSISPRISRFAQESTVFTRAYAQTAWTRASVATIMTGLYPSSHLAETRFDRLPDFIPTLAGELKANGYFTYAIVTNGNVGPEFNFHRHYDSYVQLREDSKTKEIHVQSDQLYEEARNLLNRPNLQPSYVYIHATDPHEPYTPEPFQQDLPAGCHSGDERMIRPDLKHGKESYNDAALDCVVALYDSEIRKADHYFGEFIDLLKKNDLYDRSMIILTSDHGEAFLEHGAFRHGHTLYQSEIKIPLIIHFPQEIGRPGMRVESYARHLDILPTILDLVSGRVIPGIQGLSLLGRLEEKPAEHPPFFGELTLDSRTGKYAILHPYKLLEMRKGRNTVQQLFDLMQDPQEQHDLSQEKPVRFGYMKALLQEWTETQQKRKALLKKPPGAILSKEQEEALRALGYLQ